MLKESRLIGYSSISSSGVGSTVEVSEIESLADGSVIVGDGSGAPTTLAGFTSATGTLKHEYGGIEANISAIADGGIIVGTGAGTMAIRAGALTAGAAGFLKHELGGIEADISAIEKGGLVSGTGTGTMGIQTVGTNGYFLTAQSGQASGLQWVAGAAASDVNTGTSTTLPIPPDALAGSNLGTKVLEVTAFDYATNVATGDGKAYVVIPACMNGMDLVRAQAVVITAGTTNATTVMVHNLTQGADMLSGAISIASAGVAGTVGTIDTGNDDVATDDRIRIDVDSVSTTPPQGLIIILEFRLP